MQRPFSLSLDFTGTQAPDFLKKAKNADFIVPMAPGLGAEARRLMKGLKRKPGIVDANFDSTASWSDRARFELIARRIFAPARKKGSQQ